MVMGASLIAIVICCSAAPPISGQSPIPTNLKSSLHSLTSIGQGGQVKKAPEKPNARQVDTFAFPAGKLEPRLLDAWQTAKEEGVQNAVDRLALQQSTFAENRQEIAVIVSMTPDKNPSEMEPPLKSVGATIVRSGPDTMKITLPIDRLSDLASLPGVAHVRNLHPPRPKNTTSTEGISVTLANAWHTAGHGGLGVKVAVVDSSFANLGTLKAQDEIPASATEINYTASGMSSGPSSHGSACAEIVYDMAPDAQLHLLKIDDSTDLVAVKDYCIAQGIQIVTCSIGWDALNFHDGTAHANWFTTAANHPVTVVNEATAAGILWINAAGNEQLQHTLIDWRDSGTPDDFLDWDSSGSTWNVLWKDGSTVIPAGTVIDVLLTWNRWPVSNQDFDLALYRDTGSGWTVVASSTEIQSGSATSYPFEEVYHETAVTAEYAIEVYRYSATTAPKFILRYFGVDEPQYFGYGNYLTPVPGSLAIPGDAAAAFTVGAIDHVDYTTGPIEWFSSLGPNNRAYTGGTAVTKPDICGPDWTTGVTYGSEGFSGTSASAPHIAGLAALVKGAYPSYTVSQIKQYLETNGRDLGTPGKDNTFGSGAARLPSPPLAVPPEMLSPEIHTNGIVMIRWSSTANHVYTLHYSTNLLTGFSIIQGNISATPPINTYTDNVSTVTMKFWSVSTDE